MKKFIIFGMDIEIRKKILTMKKLLFLCITFSFAQILNAQAPGYDDLKILYADANYEKLVKQAENYSLKEDLKKDPIPHVYLAKGLYKISKSGAQEEKFKNAYKDAINALSKAIKIVKDSTELLVDHMDFISEFQGSMVEMISNDLSVKDYNKASGWVMKYYKIALNSTGAKYLDGATKYRKQDKSGAGTLWKEAEAGLKKITSIEDWTEGDKNMLKIGIMETAECYISSKQPAKAKDVMNKVAPWFENDADFKEKYDSLVN
jgi:hypothetical protein